MGIFWIKRKKFWYKLLYERLDVLVQVSVEFLDQKLDVGIFLSKVRHSRTNLFVRIFLDQKEGVLVQFCGDLLYQNVEDLLQLSRIFWLLIMTET